MDNNKHKLKNFYNNLNKIDNMNQINNFLINALVLKQDALKNIVLAFLVENFVMDVNAQIVKIFLKIYSNIFYKKIIIKTMRKI